MLCEGQTEWAKNGRYTGTTELDLTEIGRQQVGIGYRPPRHWQRQSHRRSQACQVFVSPRSRAQQTFDLLFGETLAEALTDAGRVTVTEELAEWDYGAYEGLVTNEIIARRRDQGLDKERPWNIWEDGCENGEYERMNPEPRAVHH